MSGLASLGAAVRRLLGGRLPEGPLTRVLLFGAACTAAYGGLMATSQGVGPSRWEQVLYSAVKVPALLTLSAAVAFPSFFVVVSLLGLREDLRLSLRALAATQAVVAVTLLSLAPLTLLVYASTPSHPVALLANMVVFAVASAAGQVVLRRFYRPLIAKNPTHRSVLRVWIVVYGFIGVQLGWVLRPFVGTPGTETTFLREDAWGNAYLEVWGIALRAVGL